VIAGSGWRVPVMAVKFLASLGIFLSLGVAAGGISEGQLAPVFELPVISSPPDSGKPSGVVRMSLAQLRGKVVYLDFWASWCGPCRTSFPQLERLRSEFSAQGFEILAISVDEFEAEARQFLKEVPVSYPVMHDATGVTPRAYGILGMPSGYLIDRAGVVRLVHQGFRKKDGAMLRAKISSLLGE